jgi:hypothetical protein
MRKPLVRQLARAAVAVFVAVPIPAQNAPPTSAEIEQRIQRVTSGLIRGIVLKGEEHKTHTLPDRMKELNVPAWALP